MKRLQRLFIQQSLYPVIAERSALANGKVFSIRKRKLCEPCVKNAHTIKYLIENLHHNF